MSQWHEIWKQSIFHSKCIQALNIFHFPWLKGVSLWLSINKYCKKCQKMNKMDHLLICHNDTKFEINIGHYVCQEGLLKNNCLLRPHFAQIKTCPIYNKLYAIQLFQTCFILITKCEGFCTPVHTLWYMSEYFQTESWIEYSCCHSLTTTLT